MNQIDTLSVNAIRILSADAIQKANSGHPGLPLGCAAAAYELWAHHMNHNPANPKWENRDRFILSGGHGSMLLYSLLHLFGYGNLSKEDVGKVDVKDHYALVASKRKKLKQTLNLIKGEKIKGIKTIIEEVKG